MNKLPKSIFIHKYGHDDKSICLLDLDEKPSYQY